MTTARPFDDVAAALHAALDRPTTEPPPLPRGARLVDLYGPSGGWITSTRVDDDQQAADQLDRIRRRVTVPGCVALVQIGPDVVRRELRTAAGWEEIPAP